MTSATGVENPLLHPLLFLYQLLQWIVSAMLAPSPPIADSELSRPKIAVIGAGLTGVTAAAHCVGHGFDVTIFEQGDEEAVGGIWTKVNESSGLQIHSLMYRFHPSVQWTKGYPDRQQIVGQIRQLWQRYSLENKTRFNFRVENTYKDNQGRWIINNPSNGRFDGIIAAVGTCGAPSMPSLDGQNKFRGNIYHSSDLTGKDAKGKKIAIIGGGASAVEALEFAAAAGASHISILSRSEKWIIPRNILVNALLSFNIFGQETFLSFIPEFLLRKFFYRDLEDIAPAGKGIFTDTPMVNSDIMTKLREGTAQWLRGDIVGFEPNGVVINRRAKGVPKGGPGHERVVEADMIIMATGFKRPSLSFLPDDCFDCDYSPPNWYLQTFPPTHVSISAINCTYLTGLGTVGHFHIGVYLRILLMFLVDPLARPSSFWMKRWIGITKLLKRLSPVGAFDFFTYLELLWWFTFCVIINPFRWKWAVFVFFGVGVDFPKAFVRREEQLLKLNGYNNLDAGRSF